MSINTIDGFNFDMPLKLQQIKALAKYHREQLHQAIYKEDEHIGEIGIIQRAKIAAFTRALDEQTKEEFYNAYNSELEKLAVDDPLHPPHAEKGTGIFVIILALCLVAGVLYFTFLHNMVSTV